MHAEPSQYRLGLLLVAISALAWSTAGLFIRSIGTDITTMLFWRGIFAGTAVFLVFIVMRPHDWFSIVRAMRAPSLLVVIFSATGMISGIAAMRYTSIAEAMVIYATVPFVTAAVAYVFIGERPSRSTLIASAVAVTGVLVMLVDAEGEEGSLIGKGLAVLMTLSMAFLATTMRHHRNIPLLPAMGASAWLCSVVTAPFANPLAISGADLGLTALFGLLQNAVGLILFTLGSRRVPAAEATLLSALEVPLTPLWVWILFGETPDRSTLIGGSIVLVALFGHIHAELRRTQTATA